MTKYNTARDDRLQKAARKTHAKARQMPVNIVPLWKEVVQEVQSKWAGPSRMRVYGDAIRMLNGMDTSNYVQTYGRTRDAIAGTIADLVLLNMLDGDSPIPVRDYDPSNKRDVYLEAHDGLVNTVTIYIVTEYRKREMLYNRDTTQKALDIRPKGGVDGNGGENSWGDVGVAVYHSTKWVLIRAYDSVPVAHQVVLQTSEVGRFVYNSVSGGGEDRGVAKMSDRLWGQPVMYATAKAFPALAALAPGGLVPGKLVVVLSIAVISADHFWDAPTLNFVDPDWMSTTTKSRVVALAGVASVMSDATLMSREALMLRINGRSLRGAAAAAYLASKLVYGVGSNIAPITDRASATRVVANLLIDSFNSVGTTMDTLSVLKRHGLEGVIPDVDAFTEEFKDNMDRMAGADMGEPGTDLAGAYSFTTKRHTVYTNNHQSSDPYYLYPRTVPGGPVTIPVSSYIQAGQTSSANVMTIFRQGQTSADNAASIIIRMEWTDVNAQVAAMAVINPSLFVVSPTNSKEWIWRSSMPTFVDITARDTLGITPFLGPADRSMGIATVLYRLGELDSNLNAVKGAVGVPIITVVTKLIKNAPPASYTSEELKVMFEHDVVGTVDNWRDEWASSAETALRVPTPESVLDIDTVHHTVEYNKAMVTTDSRPIQIDESRSRGVVEFTDFKEESHVVATAQFIELMEGGSKMSTTVTEYKEEDGKVSTATTESEEDGGTVATETATAAPTTFVPFTSTSAPTTASTFVPFNSIALTPPLLRDNVKEAADKFDATKALLRGYLPVGGSDAFDVQEDPDSLRLKEQNLLLGMSKPPNWPLGIDNPYWIQNMMNRGLRMSGHLNASPIYYMGGSLTMDSQWGTVRERMPPVEVPITGNVFK
jgi:hypothetical protein